MLAMSAGTATAGAATAMEEKSDYELLLFRGKEAYVYQVPPAGTVSRISKLSPRSRHAFDTSKTCFSFSGMPPFLI